MTLKCCTFLIVRLQDKVGAGGISRLYWENSVDRRRRLAQASTLTGKDAMPLFVPKTLLQAAQGGAPIKRYRDFVIAYFEGEGAIAVPIGIWQPAATWANARTPSGNRMRDRGMLLMRLDVLVTRKGTTVATSVGGMVPTARLRNAMKSEGVDLKEWNFPPDDVLDKALDAGQHQDEEQAAAAEPEGPGYLTRIDADCVRSSRGWEVRRIDEYNVEYQDGPLRLRLHGVPGLIGGRQVFHLRAGTELPGAVPANLKAALAMLGLELTF